MADSKLDSILSDMEQSNLSSDAAVLRRALRDKVQFPHRRTGGAIAQRGGG